MEIGEPKPIRECCPECYWESPQGEEGCRQELCPCHAPISDRWEERFNEKFLREDGLMDKYTWDEDEEETNTTGNELKKFIRNLLISQREELVQKAKEESRKLFYQYHCDKHVPCLECSSLAIKEFVTLIKETRVK